MTLLGIENVANHTSVQKIGFVILWESLEQSFLPSGRDSTHCCSREVQLGIGSDSRSWQESDRD